MSGASGERVLVIDCASGVAAAGMFDERRMLRQASNDAPLGQAARLPVLVQSVLDGGAAGLIAVTVGPGSFTGIRAALALAQGLGAGWGCPVVGVRVSEALLAGLPEEVWRGNVWAVLHSRASRVFMARGEAVRSHALDDLPIVEAGAMLVGNAAGLVAERLRGRGVQVGWRDVESAALEDIAAIGRARQEGRRAPLAAQPLYVDAPEARLPA